MVKVPERQHRAIEFINLVERIVRKRTYV